MDRKVCVLNHETKKSLISSILSHSLFDGMEKWMLESFIDGRLLDLTYYDKGSSIYLEEDRLENLVFLIDGRVHVSRIDENGNLSLLEVCKPGHTLGSVFTISGYRSDCDFICQEKSGVAIFYIKDILENKDLKPYELLFLQNLCRFLSKLAFAFSKRLYDTVHKSTRDRLEGYLSDQYHILEEDSFSIPLNRQELADYLFVDRSSMSKELSKMQDEGYFQYRKNEFTFKDNMPIQTESESRREKKKRNR